jgi:hypothetical protein
MGAKRKAALKEVPLPRPVFTETAPLPGYSPTAAQFMEFASFHRDEKRNLPMAPNDAL